MSAKVTHIVIHFKTDTDITDQDIPPAEQSGPDDAHQPLTDCNNASTLPSDIHSKESGKTPVAAGDYVAVRVDYRLSLTRLSDMDYDTQSALNTTIASWPSAPWRPALIIYIGPADGPDDQHILQLVPLIKRELDTPLQPGLYHAPQPLGIPVSEESWAETYWYDPTFRDTFRCSSDNILQLASRRKISDDDANRILSQTIAIYKATGTHDFVVPIQDQPDEWTCPIPDDYQRPTVFVDLTPLPFSSDEKPSINWTNRSGWHREIRYIIRHFALDTTASCSATLDLGNDDSRSSSIANIVGIAAVVSRMAEIILLPSFQPPRGTFQALALSSPSWTYAAQRRLFFQVTIKNRNDATYLIALLREQQALRSMIDHVNVLSSCEDGLTEVEWIRRVTQHDKPLPERHIWWLFGT